MLWMALWPNIGALDAFVQLVIYKFGRRQYQKYDVWPGDIDPENLPTWVCLKTGHKQAQSCIMDLPII